MIDLQQMHVLRFYLFFKRYKSRDFPGGPEAKTPHSQCRGAWVQSLVKELDPSCPN